MGKTDWLPALFLPPKNHKQEISLDLGVVREKKLMFRSLSCSYSCTTVLISRENQTNALIYVNTTLFTLLQSYMSQTSNGHP